MKKEIDEAVGSINGRFGSDGWTPVMYFSRKMSQQSLLAYYNAADVGLLTPLRDGMNLIAKEFTASKENDGALILSEFAGAAEELNEALIVNPFDINAIAGVIKTAIEMPAEVKKQRFQSMKKNAMVVANGVSGLIHCLLVCQKTKKQLIHLFVYLMDSLSVFNFWEN